MMYRYLINLCLVFGFLTGTRALSFSFLDNYPVEGKL